MSIFIWAYAIKEHVYYWFKKGNLNLGPTDGCNTPGYLSGESYFSVSNMVIVELNGNEDDENRTVRLYATGHRSFPATFVNCVLSCESCVIETIIGNIGHSCMLV